MIDMESMKNYPKIMPFYSSYGEYDDEIGNILVGYPPSISDYLPIRPIRLTLVQTKNYYTSDNYWNINSIEGLISKRFFKISAVECIFFSMEDDLIEVRTVINKYDKKIAKNIYNAEYDILETFKDIFFDFLIIYREDREIKDICPSESVIIFRR